jgi:hypothetical protein
MLSLGSVACIGLVYPLARRSGMTAGLALSAAALMAFSTSMLHYAPHLFGYDADGRDQLRISHTCCHPWRRHMASSPVRRGPDCVSP